MRNKHQIAAIIAGLPGGRYRKVAAGVLRRLPEEWDKYRTVTIELSDAKPESGYASSRREEEWDGQRISIIEGHYEQLWLVTLYPAWLDGLSDAAVRWAIAHELGHAASGMACGALVIGGRLYTKASVGEDEYREVTQEEREAGEKIADAIARAWGFWAEEEAFEEEAPRLHL